MVGVTVVFRLLGGIDAEVDGDLIDLGHVRQRAVLAVLLVECNRPVAPDQLVDRIWGDQPPQRASATVYSYLSRLRRLLAPVDGVELARRSGGYVLLVDPMAVDLHRFRQLAAEAARAPDRETALSLFGQALELWRGEPFAGADTDWLSRERETALRERLAAELDRNDLALACGRHAAVLGEMQALARTHPLDERLAAQLMVALYRSGRQGEAQEVFDRVRRRLAEELGTDPGPLLRQAHHQILTGEPAAAVPSPLPAASSPAASPPVASPVASSPVASSPESAPAGEGRTVAARSWLTAPRQLPAPPPFFTGRDDLLAELDRVLAADEDRATTVVLSAIGGSGGVGKTWLALHWAHANIDLFPDGQLYVNLRGFEPIAEPLPPQVAVRGFLEALGVPDAAVPAHIETQSALFRSLTAGKRMLVMLDNARDSDQVVSLLPGSPTCTVIVTSRRFLAGLVTAHGGRPVVVGALSPEESHDLLAGQLGAARVQAEPDAAAALIDHCGGLPLALGIVVARAMRHPEVPLAVLAEELRGASTRLDALDAGELSANLRAVLACSLAALGPEAARLFALLGAAPGPDIGLAAVGSLLGEEPSRARPLLAELTHSHLIEEAVPGRYRMHDLVRIFAAERAQHSGGQEALRRLLDHYLHTAAAADVALNRGYSAVPAATEADLDLDPASALAWLHAEQQVLVSAVEHAWAARLDRHAWQLALALQVFLARRPDWPDLLATQRIAAQAAQRLADPLALTHAHRGIAIGCIGLRRFEEVYTHLVAAQDAAAGVDDPLSLGLLHRAFARLHAQQQRFDEALPHDERALELFRATGHELGQATALNAIGWHLAHLGESEQAMARCRQGLALYERLGDLFGQALTWDSLGYVHYRRGEPEASVGCYRLAVKLFSELGARGVAGSSLVDLGDACRDIGDPGAAREAWSDALRNFEEFSDPAAEEVRARLRELPE